MAEKPPEEESREISVCPSDPVIGNGIDRIGAAGRRTWHAAGHGVAARG